MTPPTFTITNNNATYTLDETVSLGCTATDADSGVQSTATTCQNINGKAYELGVGRHDLPMTVADLAGNSVGAVASYAVQATPAGLKDVASQLLGATNPFAVQVIGKYLDTAEADPVHFDTTMTQLRTFLSQEASGGALSPHNLR